MEKQGSGGDVESCLQLGTLLPSQRMAFPQHQRKRCALFSSWDAGMLAGAPAVLWAHEALHGVGRAGRRVFEERGQTLVPWQVSLQVFVKY